MFYKTDYILFIALLSMLAASVCFADTEIHRCTQADGTIAFQEVPCEESSEDVDEADEAPDPAATNEFFDFVNPFDEPPEPPQPAAATEQLSQNRAECEKTTRDAIDAIDLEMRQTSYSKEQGDEYLAELLELTRQLRACKAL